MRKLLIVLIVLQLACMSSAVSVVEPVAIGETAKRASVPTAEMVPTVESAPAEILAVYGVCADVLNVRVDHNTGASVVRNVGRMDIVTVLEWMPDGWARIGEGEYVNADYLCGGAP